MTPDLLPGFRAAAGGWWYAEATVAAYSDDLTGMRHNHGGYIDIETAVWTDDSGDRGIGLFGRYGRASSMINQIEDYVGLGVTATAPCAGLPVETIGLGLAWARNGSEYRDAVSGEGVGTSRAEAALELTAVIRACEYVAVQPAVQYIINPGTDPVLKNVLSIGLRLDVSL